MNHFLTYVETVRKSLMYRFKWKKLGIMVVVTRMEMYEIFDPIIITGSKAMNSGYC